MKKFYSFFFLAFCGTVHLGFAQNVEQLSNVGTASNLETALDQNGKIKPGIDGSFNAKGYEMGYSKNGEPVFKKVNSLNKTQTITWSALGDGVDYTVYAIAVSGGNIYVGGSFTTAGGTPANRIAKWDGNAWSALGDGVDNSVYAIAVSGTDVYAGGHFYMAGVITVKYIAKWNGSNWSALGSGMNGDVSAIAVSGNNVYAGGFFTTAGVSSANYIAKWDGNAWSALGSGMNNGVNALAVSGGEVYVGGYFTTAGISTVNYIAKWDGNAWSALGDGVNNIVYAIAVSGGNVYVGGAFTTAGISTVNYIAKWDGNAWSALGDGMNDRVYAVAVSGTDVYAGGWFTTAGGITVNYIAKWNGISWSTLGGTNYSVNALTVNTFAGKMMVGGFFTSVDVSNTSANYIASFTDSQNLLPVELTSFSAHISDNKVTLNWQTATEVNNYGFEIERRAEGSLAWTKIGFVSGAGTSNSPKEYAYQDVNLAPCVYVYRIKQIDNDGTFKYSVNTQVNAGIAKGFDLLSNYPNPFNPSTTIQYGLPARSTVRLVIYDILGQVVKELINAEQQAGRQSVVWNINAASGMYFYKLEAVSVEDPSKRFVETRKMIRMD